MIMSNVIDLTEKRKDKLMDRLKILVHDLFLSCDDYEYLVSARHHILDNHLPIAQVMIEQLEKKVVELKKHPYVSIIDRFMNIQSQEDNKWMTRK
jgi:hypothetical protein